MSTNPVVLGPLSWRIARACDSGACVGVVSQGEFVLIANTNDPETSVSRFTKQEWDIFLTGAKLGDFDDLST
jgi:hypothetical protein